VDSNKNNLGKVVPAEVCVHADAGCFLEALLAQAEVVRRPPDPHLIGCIRSYRADDCKEHCKVYAECGADPMQFLLTLRRQLSPDALVYVDVTITEHWAAEAFPVLVPRTYFNPVDNQAMGWSIPAALGGQVACPERTTVTVTGDGCFLMSGLEVSTAAREGLPVKFFILDDQAYHYMQRLQRAAYLRTTATHLARLDYQALAHGLGVGYNEITATDGLEAGIRYALATPGPVLTRVVTDYRKRPIRWINATRRRYVQEMGPQQQMRFAGRMAARALHPHQPND
jgi:acetolactate synthase-1/2/3 large subunit